MEVFVYFGAFAQLTAVALLGQLQCSWTGLGNQELLIYCAEIDVGLALDINTPLFFSYFSFTSHAEQIESTVIPLLSEVQKPGGKQTHDVRWILPFLLADFVLVYLSQLALAHQKGQHLLFSDLHSIQPIAVVESEVLHKTAIFRKQKSHEAGQSFCSQQFCEMRYGCDLICLSALARLFASEQPNYESLDYWHQSTLCPAFAQRTVKLLPAATKFCISLQDDRSVVEELQAAALTVRLGAKGKDIGKGMQVPESEGELGAHSHLRVVFEILEKQVALADCRPYCLPPIRQQQVDHCKLVVDAFISYHDVQTAANCTRQALSEETRICLLHQNCSFVYFNQDVAGMALFVGEVRPIELMSKQFETNS